MRKAVLAVTVLATAALLLSSALFAAEVKQFLGDRHKSVGIECVSCHGKDVKEIIPNQNCLSCHKSYEDLGEKTRDMHLNPHRSPHFLDLDCTSCHQGHAADQNFCQNCHGPISRGK